MFGYIKVDRMNLLGKEYEAYKGIYCGLCRQLGRDYSIFARFILSYDCTFYAMLILSLSEDVPHYCRRCCRFNPLKKCTYAESDTQALSLAAALSVSSAYYKIKDNLIDSPWYRRVPYRLLQPLFSHWRKKSLKKYPAIDEAVGEMMRRQLITEHDPTVTLDQAAEPTARMLASVCELIPDYIALKETPPNRTKRILSAFGYYLGRWIYLIDAADDYDKDMRRHNFNPLSGVVPDRSAVKDTVTPILNHALSEALLSYGLLTPGRYDPIILNVLKLSCVQLQTKILDQYLPDAERSST